MCICDAAQEISCIVADPELQPPVVLPSEHLTVAL